MTHPETVTRAKDSDLSRATQALKDAAVAYAVASTNPATTSGAFTGLLGRLTRAAEDYAEAYLRRGK